MDRAEVHFSEHKNPRIVEKEICEVTLEVHGHHVRCKVAAPDGFVAVDRAVEKLEHQLHKLKTKLKRRHKGNGRPSAPPDLAPLERLKTATPPAGRLDGDADTDSGTLDDRASGGGLRIVKSKRFASVPMTPEDAVQRMDLLGHGFFFFTNLDTHRAAVVYRRDDGDVGLIDEDAG
jgi:putative sigma-54 modulation protein